MEPITGIILAGGKSSRMGTDKGLIQLAGKPMIQHIIEPLATICDRILIVSGNSEYAKFGFELVQDEVSDFGPVAGILSGLRKSKTQKNLVLSCDSPYITTELLLQLVAVATTADVVLACTETEQHPLIALYDRSCLIGFEKAVIQCDHRLTDVLEHFNVVKLLVKKHDLVRNINTPQDLTV